MSPKKNPDFYKLNKSDRILALSGVPVPLLSSPIELKKFSFENVSYKISNRFVSITSKAQREFLLGLLENIHNLGTNGLYVIGSHPTDRSSLNLATLLSREYYNTKLEGRVIPKVKWIDVGTPDWSYKTEESDSDLLTVFGLSKVSDTRKLEIAKDFLRHGSNSTRVVQLVAPNVLEFAIEKLEVNPDAVFQIGRTVTRTIV